MRGDVDLGPTPPGLVLCQPGGGTVEEGQTLSTELLQPDISSILIGSIVLKYFHDVASLMKLLTRSIFCLSLIGYLVALSCVFMA